MVGKHDDRNMGNEKIDTAKLAAELCGTRADWTPPLKRKPKRKRVSKAQALVDFGLAANLKDAREQLRDMGEV